VSDRVGRKGKDLDWSGLDRKQDVAVRDSYSFLPIMMHIRFFFTVMQGENESLGLSVRGDQCLR